MQHTIEFTKHHGPENNMESQRHYEADLKKLSNNCRIILEQLLTGRKLTGIDVVKLGIMEYRKRFDDLKKVYGIPVRDDYAQRPDGSFERYKVWWLEKGFINEYLNCATS